ncbi:MULTISPECIES: carboxymuconolactone decarboxylase family protein [Paracoccus]|uniref:AhpD family alkylhydroperoxidase n=1 Tax=Paracoccus versutus TaxID=34007 RepID=A0A3D9XG84_PARVE|nr:MULTISPECIES: carboxymuconolactone decarboxylase family protein [Paracoccus]REF69510.1 AhpD family alkylhydroperoxidase [Paracoccus versutus]WGR58106.1 carboxymuconolactone decarboxylase family protein [Paracoccus versutus]
MADISMPKASAALGAKRHALAPAIDDAFLALSKAVFADGALDKRTKQLIAVAVAHVTQCPWCIEGHVKGARREGASPEQIMEAIWVAAEMRAGAAHAHANKALAVLDQIDGA